MSKKRIMNRQAIVIRKEDSIRDIVLGDYRTADIFSKYGIKFCCGGNLSLEKACASMNIDLSGIVGELERASTAIQIGNDIRFQDWEPSFLSEFIVHVHHQHLKNSFPVVKGYVQLFLDSHQTKFPELKDLGELVDQLIVETSVAMQDEEEIYFPYIKRIAHAFLRRESYGDLLMRTLRKPLKVIETRNDTIKQVLNKIRLITSDYVAPENSCVTHKVTFFNLNQLDTDLRQHLYLENEILIPKAMQIEKDLLILNTP